MGTMVMDVTDEQRRVVARHLSDHRFGLLGRLLSIGAVLIGYLGYAAWMAASSGLGQSTVLTMVLLGAAVAAVTVLLLLGRLLWRYFRMPGEPVVMRTTGEMAIEYQAIDEGGPVRFVLAEGQEVTLDDDVPKLADTIGAIEYTERQGYPLAVWDRDGRIVWRRPGYEPYAMSAHTRDVTA